MRVLSRQEAKCRNGARVNVRERIRPAATNLAIVRSIADELGSVEWRTAVLRDRLYDAVRDAVDSGVPQATVALAAGVSRQRVGQILALTVLPQKEAS